MTLNELVAYVHATASALPPQPSDLVELKWTLKELAALTEQALEATRNEIKRGRRGGQAGATG